MYINSDFEYIYLFYVRFNPIVESMYLSLIDWPRGVADANTEI